MGNTAVAAAIRGARAGVTAGLVQTGVGKLEEKLLLPPGEDADIAPRLVARLTEDVGGHLSAPAKWALGTLFHFGYAAAWGAAYALAWERRPLPPLLAGALFGTLIYTLTFPRWGLAVLTRTERPPGTRSRRMTMVDWSVALTFGLATALAYRRADER